MMSQYQKRHVWTEKLSKTEKAFALSNGNGHIWTDKNDTKTLRVERQFLKNGGKKKLLRFRRKWIRLDGA